MISRKQRWWLETHGYKDKIGEFENMSPKEIFEQTKPRKNPGDLLRCNKCSYVFARHKLKNGYCEKCFTLNEYKNHPTWQSLKLMRDSINYLLQCDPNDICNSKWADKIIELGDSPVWKTIPKE